MNKLNNKGYFKGIPTRIQKPTRLQPLVVKGKEPKLAVRYY